MTATTLLSVTLLIAQVILALAMAAAVFRVLRGPRAQDRILALDALYVDAALMLVVFCMQTGSATYFEIALVAALLGFAGTVALAKFLMRGEVIE